MGAIPGPAGRELETGAAAFWGEKGKVIKENTLNSAIKELGGISIPKDLKGEFQALSFGEKGIINPKGLSPDVMIDELVAQGLFPKGSTERILMETLFKGQGKYPERWFRGEFTNTEYDIMDKVGGNLDELYNRIKYTRIKGIPKVTKAIQEVKGIPKELKVKPVPEIPPKTAGIAPPTQRLPPGGGKIPPELIRKATQATEGKVHIPAEATGKITKRQIRIDKYDLNEAEIQNLEKRVEALGLTQYQIKTADDVEKAAIELGTDKDALLRTAKTSLISDDEVKALRDLTKTNTKIISSAHQEILLHPELKPILELRIAKASEEINKAQTKLVGGGTQAGRVVNAFKAMARETLAPDFWFYQAKKMLGDRKLTEQIMADIRGIINTGDISSLSHYVSMLRNSTWTEKATTLWKAGLLTSPTTHAANIGGNITMAGLELTKDIFALPADMMVSLFTGKRTIKISPNTISAQARGAWQGLKKAGKGLMTGQFDHDLITKYDLPRKTVYNNKIIQSYTDAIFNSLQAEDVVFREIALQKSLAQQAELIAETKGLKGLARKTEVKNLILAPTDEMVLNAIDAAEYATFQSESWLSRLGAGARRVAGPPGQVILPFTKTPANVALRIVDYTPVGFAKAFVKLLKKNQKTFAESFGRAVTGSGIIGLGYELALQGLITGNLPTDPQEKAMWEAEGKQANSVKIDGAWRQLNRVSPLGSLLTMGANIYATKEAGKEGIDLITTTGAKTIKGLTEMTFLKGTAGVISAIAEPERKMSQFVNSTIASVIPSIVGRIARSIDTERRKPEGIVETLKTRIPFISQTVPVRRDIFGEPIPTGGGKWALVDPFESTEARYRPVLEEAKRLKIQLGLPGNRISGIKLTNEEYDRYQELHGKLLHSVTDKLINNEEYKALSDEEKEEIFDETIKKIRRIGTKNIFSELMRRRYDISTEINAQMIKKMFSKINHLDEFGKMSSTKQEEFIKKIFAKLAENIEMIADVPSEEPEDND
ncbi:MAG: hypothetical protein QME51_05675 [Planctomycetota bacterium]|nr:hypothetical protein [Planctomycetota bacterium]